MKIVVALCLFAVLCTVDAFNELDRLRNQLQNSKSTVNSNIRTLERLDSKTKFDTKMKAQNKLIENLQMHNNHINPTIDAIRNEVAAAKAEGKNAQPCFDNALANLRVISLTAKKEGDQCVESATSAIKSKLNFIENLLATGRQLDAQLDKIFPGCYDSNIFRMQNCIAIQLGTTNAAVRDFVNSVNSAENTARNASNDVVLEASNCISNVYAIALSKITDVRLTATKCVKSL